MIDLTHPEEVKKIQDSLRIIFGSAQGKDFMEFLEQLCGWYDFGDIDTNTILIKAGKRQVLATLKTLISLNPNEVAQIASMET